MWHSMEAFFVTQLVCRRLLTLIESLTPRQLRTLNGRLPLEHGSDRPQTLGKRVSDDLQLSIFRRRKQIFDEKFRFGKMFFVIFGGFWRS